MEKSKKENPKDEQDGKLRELDELDNFIEKRQIQNNALQKILDMEVIERKTKEKK